MSEPERMTEERATELAQLAIDEAGGTRMIYRNPRQSFSLQATRTFSVEGHEVEVRWGEISSPAVASVGGYVFEIHETDFELLIRPPKRRPTPGGG
jgi:hypothetical protein